MVKVIGKLDVQPVAGYELAKCWILNTVAAVKEALLKVLLRNNPDLIVGFII